MNAMTKVAVSNKSRPLCGAPSEPGAGQEQMLREVGPDELARIEGGTMYYYYWARSGTWIWSPYPPWTRG